MCNGLSGNTATDVQVFINMVPSPLSERSAGMFTPSGAGLCGTIFMPASALPKMTPA
ncbi:hypothetical protein [Candidatus Fukatsuia symbiotica]|uniref:hypothetical protein n=1 Tax=Candidatus Fukatsuia symbiotica TaxID=1878942 RepID=UPI0013C45907|nr:hypothetical protein [Candidatus Fukatsuia symbiotica]